MRVDIREIAYIETVDQREIHSGVFQVEMALEVACVFQREEDFFFAEVVFAEDVEPVFVEIAIEAGTYLADLAFDYPPEWLCEPPVFILDLSDIAAVLKSVAVSAADDPVHLLLVFGWTVESGHFRQQLLCDVLPGLHSTGDFDAECPIRSLEVRTVLIDERGITAAENGLQAYLGVSFKKAGVEFSFSHICHSLVNMLSLNAFGVIPV